MLPRSSADCIRVASRKRPLILGHPRVLHFSREKHPLAKIRILWCGGLRRNSGTTRRTAYMRLTDLEPKIPVGWFICNGFCRTEPAKIARRSHFRPWLVLVAPPRHSLPRHRRPISGRTSQIRSLKRSLVRWKTFGATMLGDELWSGRTPPASAETPATFPPSLLRS